tara:strand:- start:2457 stop:2945 length:489 start_codon:yes stop_codon:yes gene_type:complete
VKKIIIILGVSGCGKSTLGIALAEELGVNFIEGDSYHPQTNIIKMKDGIPLTDKDREPWLIKLSDMLLKHQPEGAVIACSALKESYRKLLSRNITKNNLLWVYLKCGLDQLKKRMNQRDHFMPLSLLKSQMDTLEEPKKGLYLKCTLTVNKQIKQIKKKLNE